MCNKTGAYILIGILSIFLIWQTDYARHKIFLYLDNSTSSISGIEVTVQNDWFEVLNTENSVLSRLVSVVFDNKTEYPTVGFDKISCDKEYACTIDIDIPDSKDDFSLINVEPINLPWGNVYYLGEWCDDSNTSYYAYYNPDYNIRITVTNNEFMQDLVNISYQKGRRSKD